MIGEVYCPDCGARTVDGVSAIPERSCDTCNPDNAAPFDMVGAIVAFEQGDLDGPSTLTLFSNLVRTGAAWTLQGSYGRTAAALIQNGYLDQRGRVLKSEPEE